MKQSKRLESLLFDSISMADKHRIRLKVPVDVLIEFVIFWSTVRFCGTQTDFISIAQAADRLDFSLRKRLQLILEP